MSRDDLVSEQKVDPSSSQLFDATLSTEDGKSAVSGYLLQAGLLVRKWVSHREDVIGKPVF